MSLLQVAMESEQSRRGYELKYPLPGPPLYFEQ